MALASSLRAAGTHGAVVSCGEEMQASLKQNRRPAAVPLRRLVQAFGCTVVGQRVGG